LINLRYHIVSITAVFLALGIGIATGSTFLGKATIDQIEKNIDNAEREVRTTRAENDRLRDEVGRLDERGTDLTEQATGRMFDGRLEDVPVVVISAPGVDEDSFNALTGALEGSAAGFEGSLTATDKLTLSEGDARDLSDILDTTIVDPAALRRILVSRLADVLLDAARRPPATASTTSSTSAVVGEGRNLLQGLIDGGFLDYTPAPGGGASAQDLLTEQGYRYVVVSGPEPDLPDTAFLRPLLRALSSDRPAPVVVASAATGGDAEKVRGAVVSPLLEDDTLAGRISTVDDLEQFSGVAAVVLALEDLAEGRRGHYGVGDGASSLLPASPGD